MSAVPLRQMTVDPPLDTNEVSVLRSLKDGPLTAVRVRERAGMTSAEVTPALDRLERRWLIRRGADPGLAGATVYSLTNAGQLTIGQALTIGR